MYREVYFESIFVRFYSNEVCKDSFSVRSIRIFVEIIYAYVMEVFDENESDTYLGFNNIYMF